MKNRHVARSRLDTKLQDSSLKDLPRPHRGWVRAIRESLGMTAADLGRRIGVSQQSVVDLEKNELRATVRLETLERAAAAMDCELVYAIVPRTSLAEIVEARALEKAHQLVLEVSHHSRLEDQAVSEEDFRTQVNELAAELTDQRGLWRDQ